MNRSNGYGYTIITIIHHILNKKGFNPQSAIA
jgi:hypothetical protein